MLRQEVHTRKGRRQRIVKQCSVPHELQCRIGATDNANCHIMRSFKLHAKMTHCLLVPVVAVTLVVTTFIDCFPLLSAYVKQIVAYARATDSPSLSHSVRKRLE